LKDERFLTDIGQPQKWHRAVLRGEERLHQKIVSEEENPTIQPDSAIQLNYDRRRATARLNLRDFLEDPSSLHRTTADDSPLGLMYG
jgi:hypothetical protein